MARKPRPNRPRLAVPMPDGAATQVLENATPVRAATAAVQPPRQRVRGAGAIAIRPVDYGYVTTDVIRIAVLTAVIVVGMVALSFVMPR